MFGCRASCTPHVWVQGLMYPTCLGAGPHVPHSDRIVCSMWVLGLVCNKLDLGVLVHTGAVHMGVANAQFMSSDCPAYACPIVSNTTCGPATGRGTLRYLKTLTCMQVTHPLDGRLVMLSIRLAVEQELWYMHCSTGSALQDAKYWCSTLPDQWPI
jgi:hypothetical protein